MIHSLVFANLKSNNLNSRSVYWTFYCCFTVESKPISRTLFDMSNSVFRFIHIIWTFRTLPSLFSTLTSILPLSLIFSCIHFSSSLFVCDLNGCLATWSGTERMLGRVTHPLLRRVQTSAELLIHCLCVSAQPHIYNITTLSNWGFVMATNKQRDIRGSDTTIMHRRSQHTHTHVRETSCVCFVTSVSDVEFSASCPQ